MSHTSTRTDKRIERWEWQITAGRRRWREALLALDARKIDPRPPRCWSRKGFTFSFIDLTDPTRIYAATSFRHRIFLTSE